MAIAKHGYGCELKEVVQFECCVYVGGGRSYLLGGKPNAKNIILDNQGNNKMAMLNH